MMKTDTTERKAINQQLSQADQQQYRHDGYFFPLRIFSTKKAADHREQLENLRRYMVRCTTKSNLTY